VRLIFRHTVNCSARVISPRRANAFTYSIRSGSWLSETGINVLFGARGMVDVFHAISLQLLRTDMLAHVFWSPEADILPSRLDMMGEVRRSGSVDSNVSGAGLHTKGGCVGDRRTLFGHRKNPSNSTRQHRPVSTSGNHWLCMRHFAINHHEEKLSSVVVANTSWPDSIN
jgi:hypothetical protein